MRNKILMPKGIALWLTKETKLTDEQIATFCKMHPLEIKAYRNGLHVGVTAYNPIEVYALDEANIRECEANSTKQLNNLILKEQQKNKNTRNYAKKHDIVNAVFWLIKHYPDMSEKDITKLLGCTKSLVQSVKDKTYKDYHQLISKNPVQLGHCFQEDLDKIVFKYL